MVTTTFIVTVNPLPTAEAGNNDTITNCTSENLTASGGSAYHWNTNENTEGIAVNPSITTWYWVTVTNSYQCSAKDSVLVVVNNFTPATPGSITGNAAACESVEQTYSISSVPNATSYLWTAPTSWVIESGQGTTSMQATPYGLQSGNITVAAVNNCGTSAPMIKSIIDNDVHPVIDTITGPLSVCEGSSVVYNASTSFNNALAYTWNVPTGWTIKSGQGGSSITVTAGTIGDNGNVVVNAENGCGTSDAYNLVVTVNPLPTHLTLQKDSICYGNTITLTATGGSSYNWSNKASTASIDISPLVTTSYTVTVSNAYGCTNADTVIVHVNPLPRADAGFNASIAVGDSAQLIASGGTQYLWTTSQTTNAIWVKPTTATIYTVTVTDANGCSAKDDATVLVGNSNMPYALNYWQKNDSVITTIPGVNKVGIGVDMPKEVLSVGGNVYIMDTLKVDRIIANNDSGIIELGNHSIHFDYMTNIIYAKDHFTHNGHDFSIPSGIGIGVNTNAQSPYACSIGNYVASSANTAITIGSGIDNYDILENNKDNTLFVGFNSNLPTLFVGPANGSGTTGKVGIGTTDPKDKLQIGDNYNKVAIGTLGQSDLGWSTGYIGFNAVRNQTNSHWELSSDNAPHNAGGVIMSNIGDAMIFIQVATGTTSPLSDATLYSKRVMTMEPLGSYGTGWGILNVCGLVKAKEFEATTSNWWADFVFNKNYKLTTLTDLEKYINQNKHLPDLPTANEVKENGYKLTDMDATLLQKIEELTLYIINMQKQIDEFKKNQK